MFLASLVGVALASCTVSDGRSSGAGSTPAFDPATPIGETQEINVSINGTAVLTNFDTYAAAGAKNKAVVREFTTTSNSSGQIVVQFTNVTGNASLSDIEILK